ncbi:bifunctional YncE family protein/alkaline phosphatase family protein [Flavisolibacter nicotianae]|uniref:bifunctional YncE family protein/alkaline phosphatase family protein n=1 Tax=Flavisolibacter nicotianae TaxID=2364882 RepID=UPI000EACCD28|nr:bifunctional YncE family protein/alkaline phosphatase family protein [Flavisolibacter nicotianae]
MKRITILLVFLQTIGQMTFAQQLNEIEKKRVKLPNGWSLTPVGRQLPLGDLPLNIAVSRSQRYLAVTNNGQSTQSIQLVDVKTEMVLDNKIIGKSWGGLVFSSDEKFLYASGGNDNWILKYAINHGKLTTVDTITLGAPWPNKISPAGITLDDQRQVLYVVTKEDNSLYVFDLKTKSIKQKLPLGGEAYTCLLSPDKRELYISGWAMDKILVYDTWRQKLIDSVAVSDNPNDLFLSSTGTYLYVSNANDNSVSVIDIKKRKLLETLNAALYATRLSGSTTNSVALSSNEKTLYIANADNNCLAVFDVSRPGKSTSKGFIPTGWYPTCVRIAGNKIFVTNGKGLAPFANPKGPNPSVKKEPVVLHEGIANKPDEVQYIAGMFKGALSIIDLPSEKALAAYSQAVYRNIPYHLEDERITEGEEDNPVPRKVGEKSPIKHVFYLIKENRTYDQVLGDLPQGNGDKSLVLFGEKITPNQHALAKQFVLLDNFYVDGEVSSDGHNWSMGAYATDFLEKNWPSHYGRRGSSEASSGLRAVANNKDGFIWDNANRSEVSFRTYGEFSNNQFLPQIPVLKNHLCPYFPSFNGSIRDTARFGLFKREFDSLLAVNAVPQLVTIKFPNDHTEGTAVGRPTPFAHVADNDLAVGMLVEYLSKSPIWKESVIFILEDDAQNGPDHVDAHRSTAYVAGGFVKRGFVDHTMYSTSSVLRTIEFILGMPPMTQYDAAATPMWRCFAKEPDRSGFMSLPAEVDLNEKNGGDNKLTRLSNKLDFSNEDRVPDPVLNEILWKYVHGENSTMPVPVRAAFFKGKDQKEEDDDKKTLAVSPTGNETIPACGRVGRLHGGGCTR